MSRIITAPGVLTNVQGQIDHVTDMYNDIKDNNLKPLTITLDPVSNANGAVSVTTEDDRITEDMKAVTLEVGTPEVFKAPVTVTTGTGTATLTCSNATGTSTVTVTFIKTSPVEGGEDYPPAVTSTEFDILADRIGSLSSLDTTDKSDLVSAVNEVNNKMATLNGNFAKVEGTFDSSGTATISYPSGFSKTTTIIIGSLAIQSNSHYWLNDSSISYDAISTGITLRTNQSLFYSRPFTVFLMKTDPFG